MKQSVRLLDLPADRMDGEVVAVLFFEDERPLKGPAALLDWRMNGLLTRRLLRSQSSGSRNEKILVDANTKILAPWVLFQGAGRRQGIDRERWKGVIGDLLKTVLDAGFRRMALCLSPLHGEGTEEIAALVREELARLGSGRIECLVSVDEAARREGEQETPGPHGPDVVES